MLRATTLSRAAVILALAAFMPSSAFADLTNCQKNFNNYKKAPGRKAFATTLGNDPGYHPGSCSFVAGYSVKKLAEKKAIENCNRIRRREDGGKCKVIDSK